MHLCTVLLLNPLAQQCKYEECNSKRDKRPVTCVVEDIPEDGKIVSIEIVEEKKKNKCTENENYGFNMRSIWVSDKCSAEFKVCFIKGKTNQFHRRLLFRSYCKSDCPLYLTCQRLFSKYFTKCIHV